MLAQNQNISSVMRIWTIHPRYLDAKGLVAAWREGLLAQKVLRGETRGYGRHPQLRRFQAQRFPLESIAAYLDGIAREAALRGFEFNVAKIAARPTGTRMIETRGQLTYEWSHLRRKLRARAPEVYRVCAKIDRPKAHPLFRIVAGPVRAWEKRTQAKQSLNRALRKNGERGQRVSSRW